MMIILFYFIQDYYQEKLPNTYEINIVLLEITVKSSHIDDCSGTCAVI